MGAAEQAEDPRVRRRAVKAVKQSMRGLRNDLTLLNRRIGARVELRDVDLDCLDLIGSRGPIGPSTLARAAGLHPATMTGILDRLERGGWIVRERAATDRRSVVVRTVADRIGELYQLFSPMNNSLDEICTDYTTAELDLIADFLQRSAVAGRDSTRALG